MTDQTPRMPGDEGTTPTQPAPATPAPATPEADKRGRNTALIIVASVLGGLLVVGAAVGAVFALGQHKAIAQRKAAFAAAQAHMDTAFDQLGKAADAKPAVDALQPEDAEKVLSGAEDTIGSASAKAIKELDEAKKAATAMQPSQGRSLLLAAIAQTKVSALEYQMGATGLGEAAPMFTASTRAATHAKKAGEALDDCTQALNSRSFAAADRAARTANTQADATIAELAKMAAAEKRFRDATSLSDEILKSARLTQKAARMCQGQVADARAGRVASFNKKVDAYNDLLDQLGYSKLTADLLADPKMFISQNRIDLGDAGRDRDKAIEMYHTASKRLTEEVN